MGRKPAPESKKRRGERLVRELVEARERTQLSQLDLSSRSGITLDAIRKIERGVVLEPGFFTVADLAIALGLDLARLAEPVDR
jgi:transcriptional regulator with XRE-family HTH domain